MKRTAAILIQAVIALIGAAALAILIWFPMTEGRAENLDVFHIYFDPFILYCYATSAVFFIGLYKTFKLLGYIEQKQIFSSSAVKAVKNIKYYSVTLSVLGAAAGLNIWKFHNKDDDPIGFLVICLALIFIAIAVAVASAAFEKYLQNGIVKKLSSEQNSNEQSII